jgi:hypothetical protein
MPPNDCGRLHDECPGFPVLPRPRKPGSQESIRWRQFRALHGTLQNSDLGRNGENVQLERGTAAIYQLQRDAIAAVKTCPKGNRTISDKSRLDNAIGVHENHIHAHVISEFTTETTRIAECVWADLLLNHP